MKVWIEGCACRGVKMDKVDKQIIAALQEDARVSLAQLSRQVHKSRTAVEARVQKLIDNGVILGFTINVAKPEQSEQTAFLMLTLHGNVCHLVFPQIHAYSEIIHAYSLFGDTDMMLQVSYQQFEELMVLKDNLMALEHVADVVINPVLKAWR